MTTTVKPKSIISTKYTVERKDTIQHILEANDGNLRKCASKDSVLTLPESRQNSSPRLLVQRSTSVDAVPCKHRVTYKDEVEDTAENQEEHLNDTISKYYNRNHYTVTGNENESSNSYKQLARNASTNRFQVDKASLSQLSQVSLAETIPMLQQQERQFDHSFYWFAMHRKKFGFRYIALLLLAATYTLLGATVFYLIEGSHETSSLRVREQNLDQLLDHLATVLSEAVNDPEQSSEHRRMKEFIKQSYISLQKQEELYKWSTFYRLEHQDNLKWSFSSAFFFSMNVYTTTGYGSISAQTFSGQLFTMIYAFCFVPMTLVILRDLGQLFLVNFTKLYAHILTLLRRLRGKREIDENEIIQLPVTCCMAILIAYLLFSTTFVYLYDAGMGPEWDDGLPYFTAFYFSFISLTTIGLGDVMPNNVPYAPPVSIIFFIGMAVTKVVNRATFIAVENGVFGLMTLAETKIDYLLTPKTIDTARASSPSSPRASEFHDSSSSTESVMEHATIDRRRQEMMNTFTVRSIATFMRSNHDVYGGGFGRVQLRRGDLLNNNAHTVAATHRIRPLA